MKFPIEVPCIRVSQPLGEFFLCSLTSEILQEVTFWVPATAEVRGDGVFSFIKGVQRRLSPERASAIGDYIDGKESTFPNTVIVSANFGEDDSFESDETLRWQVTEKSDGCCSLMIPSRKKLASVIDGQHRIEGFKYSKKADRKAMQVPCAVFFDLPKAYQANIFATINFNQKPVSKSLAYQLFGYELDERDSKKWTPNLLALFIARILNAEESSPFRGHIKLAVVDVASGKPLAPTGEWSISIAAVVEGIEKLISSDPAGDKHKLLSGEVDGRRALPDDQSAPLRTLFQTNEDKEIYRIIESFFSTFSEILWERQKVGNFLTRTVGILAAFDLLRLMLLRNPPKSVGVEAKRILQKVPNIDFSTDFFHASGAGRVRIRNVLGIATGIISYDELQPASADVLRKFFAKLDRGER